MGQEGMTPEVAKKFKYWQTRTIIASFQKKKRKLRIKKISLAVKPPLYHVVLAIMQW